MNKRVAAVVAATACAAGLVVGRHDGLAEVAWGDAPTWLAFITAALVGVIALVTLRSQQRQIGDEARRNLQRDALMDAQLVESQQRADAIRRYQAEQVKVDGWMVRSYRGRIASRCHIENQSFRPVRSVASRLVRDGGELLRPEAYAVQSDGGRLRSAGPEDMADGAYLHLLAGLTMSAGFVMGTVPEGERTTGKAGHVSGQVH